MAQAHVTSRLLMPHQPPERSTFRRKYFRSTRGLDCKRVRVELQRLHPRATIDMLREGEKQRGVRADRITIVVDAKGDVVAAPRVG